MELGTETSITRSTGLLVFKNPNCKTCYQIIENSIFIYLVLPKKGETWQHFPVSPKTKKRVEKTGKYTGSESHLLRTLGWRTRGASGQHRLPVVQKIKARLQEDVA